MFDVLPRIGLIENEFNLKSFDHILVPDKKYKFQIETLKLLKIYDKSLSSKKNKRYFSISSPTSYFVLNPYTKMNYRYEITIIR